MANSDFFFKKILNKFSEDLSVAMIGKVDSYNPNNNTVKIVPQHKASINGVEQDYPPLINIPVATFNIGGFSIKYPVNEGDYMLLIFFDYDIDNLIIDGTTSSTSDRKHDINDCIVLPLGFNFLQDTSYNQDNSFNIVKNDGKASIKIDSAGNVEINSTGKVYLGGATGSKAVALAEELKNAYDNHTHTAPADGGTTSTPSNSFPNGSNKVFSQ